MQVSLSIRAWCMGHVPTEEEQFWQWFCQCGFASVVLAALDQDITAFQSDPSLSPNQEVI